MSGSWSDSEYISSYSFILARGIRSICMITPEILLPVMWACRSRHRVQIDVQLQAPMMSWHCWLLFIYKWVNALIYIYTVTHTHVCKHACMHASLCYFLYPDNSVWGAGVHEGNRGYMLSLCSSLLAWTVPVWPAGEGGWLLQAVGAAAAFDHFNRYHHRYCIPTEQTNVRLLFSLGYSKCLRDREKKGHGWNLIEIGKGSLDKRAGANTTIPFEDALNVITFLPGYLRASSSYAYGVERVAYQRPSWLDPSPLRLGHRLH